MSRRTTLARKLDTVLDRSVAFGYSNIGYWLRKPAWSDEGSRSLSGTTLLITGGTAGIGLAAARQCAKRGATLHLLGHLPDRAEAAVEQLRQAVPSASVTAEVVDLSSLAQIRDFCADLAQRVPQLDALVHNAGTFAESREETADGHEQTLAIHVLGPHLMTKLLTPALRSSGDGRVAFMTSGGMYAQPLRSDDPEFRDDDYSGSGAYARTKRMQVALAETWAERLADEGISVFSMHPGWVDTPGVRRFLPVFRAVTRPFIRTPDQGADTLTWLLSRPDGAELRGKLWHDRRSRPVAYGGRNAPSDAQKRQLWDYCETAVADYAPSEQRRTT